MFVTIDSNQIIKAFKMFGELFKKYTLDTNLTFEVEDNILKARVGASSFISVNFPILSSEGLKNLKCKTHFIDISKVIEKDSEVTLEIDEDFLVIKTKKININLPSNMAEAPKRDYESHEFEPLDRDLLFSSMSKLIKMNTLAGIYKTDGSFSLCGGFMQRKFAVAFMQTECEQIKTNIDLNNANLLFSFIRNSDYLEIAEYPTYYVFKSSVFYLGIPKSPPNGIVSLDEISKDYKELGDIDLGEDDPLSQLKNIKDLLGDKNVEIHFYKNAISVHKVTNNADVNISIGELNLDDYLLTAETLMGVFFLIISIIGPKFKLLKGGNSICLMTGTCTSIVSVV